MIRSASAPTMNVEDVGSFAPTGTGSIALFVSLKPFAGLAVTGFSGSASGNAFGSIGGGVAVAGGVLAPVFLVAFFTGVCEWARAAGWEAAVPGGELAPVLVAGGEVDPAVVPGVDGGPDVVVGGVGRDAENVNVVVHAGFGTAFGGPGDCDGLTGNG